MSFKVLGAVVAALTIIGALSVIDLRSANAKPEFAAATGKPCGACHANPAGGGKLTAAGEKYKASIK